jgi:iron complex outermembrane receptor protein
MPECRGLNRVYALLVAAIATVVAAQATAQSGDDAPQAASEASAGDSAKGKARKSAATRDGRIEEVIVYARKRAELIEDTPVSITALSGAQLAASGVTRLDQVQNLVPNLTIFRTLSDTTVSINLRGVGNFPFVYYDQGVGLYVDGVFLARNSGSVLDIVDVEQMEVLRGPQGTLFGKNTLGGAISITTVKPHDELEIYGLIRTGSYDQIDTRMTLNVPIPWGYFEDKLFSRVTFATFKHDGYTYNVFRDEHASDRNTINFLGTLRYLPFDDVTFDLSGTWSRTHQRPPGYQCVWVDADPIPNAITQPAIDQTVVANGGQPGDARENCNASSPYRFYGNEFTLSDVKSYGTWGILNWEIGDAWIFSDLHLKYTGSWREQVSRTRLDTDGTQYPIGRSSTAGGNGEVLGNPGNQEQIQQELQVNATAWENRIKAVGGLFGYWENAQTDTGLVYFPDSVLEILGTNFSRIDTDNWTWAIYTQATADFTDWLSISTGIRYTEDKKGIDRVLVRPLVPDAPADFDGSEKTDDWTPMASLALKAPDSWLEPARLDHLMGYFTYARGFRGGGFNGGATLNDPEDKDPFKPEYLDSFEWGLKTVAFDRRFHFSFAFFLEKREDQQVPQIVGGNCPEDEPDCVPPLRVLTRNAAESESKGVEIEFQALPFPGLAIDGSVGYLDAEFGGFDGAEHAITGDPIDRKGQSFTFIPPWNTHLGVQYAHDISPPGPTWLEGTVTPRFDWSWKDSVDNWAPELRELHQDSYHLVNFRLTYVFNDTRAQIAFFIDNLIDEEYFIDSLAVGPQLTGAVQRYYEKPRWYGGEISYRFN